MPRSWSRSPGTAKTHWPRRTGVMPARSTGSRRRLLANETLAEEVMQEVFLRLWNHPDRFEPSRGSLRSYLLAQTHGRVGRPAAVRGSSAPARGARGTRVPPRAATTSSTRSGIWRRPSGCEPRSLRSPTESGRRSSSRYFGGHTYREVAALLSEPEGTVKSRIRSGLKRMRSTLVDIGTGGPS